MERRDIPLVLAAVVCLAGSGVARAETYVVPDDFALIQSAIDFASRGDEILVRAGTYHENLVIEGKSLTVTSEEGADATILDGSSPIDPGHLNTVYIFGAFDVVFEGFSIMNADARSGLDGGGMHLYIMSGTIRDCIIESNQAMVGGGIYLYNCSPTIEDCVIRSNVAGWGAGIASDGVSAPTIRRSLVIENATAAGETGFGGGLWVDGPAIIESCTVAGNSADLGAGIFVRGLSGQARIERTLSVFNQGRGISCGTGQIPRVLCCDIFGNAAGDAWCGVDEGGNLTLDPQFCESDYTIREGSPCSPEQSPTGCGLVGARPVGCTVNPVAPSTWGRIKMWHR